jgi:hypothetical protein
LTAVTSARRSVVGSRSGFRRPVASEFITSPDFFLSHAVHHRGGRGVCARRWKCRVWCSRWCRGEVFPG